MTVVETDTLPEFSHETYTEYLADYKDIHGEPVYEDDTKLVFADGHGHEMNEWADLLDLDRGTVVRWHHNHAEDADYNWSTSDPVVLLKEADE